MGNDQLVCMVGGAYFPDGGLPHCVTGCPLSGLDISNLTQIDGHLLAMDRDVPLGQTVTLTCLPGATFGDTPSYSVTCNSAGMWQGVPTQKCVPQVTN